MPTYGYRCTECKHEFQVFQGMKEDPISVCPQCKGAVKRLLYPVGIVFKGSGWYINDSRKPEVTREGSSDGKSEGKSDATEKPADTTSGDTAKSEPAKSDPKPVSDKAPVSATT